MRVKELKEILSTMPENAFVNCIWDGEPRSSVRHVWIARSGKVMLSDENEVVYSEESRPVDAPEGLYWHTPRAEDEGEEEI